MPEAKSTITPSPPDVAVAPFNLRHATKNSEVVISARHSLTWPALMRALPVESPLEDTPDTVTPTLAITSSSVADVTPSTPSSPGASGPVAPLAVVSVMAVLSARVLTKPARRTVAMADDLIVRNRT